MPGVSFQSRVVVVTQPERWASADSAPPVWFGPPFEPSVALGVFQAFRDEPEALSDMRSTDARSAQIDRPDGVVLSFQVSLNKVEPTEAVFARNLLSKDLRRSADANEMVPVRP